VEASLPAPKGGAPTTERKEVDTVSGDAIEVLLLGPAATGSKGGAMDWSLPGWLSLGVGGAGAIVFAATGIVVLGQCDAEIGDESFVCVDDEGTPTDAPTGLLAANVVGLVVGVAGVGLGVTFLIVEATDDDGPSATVTAFGVPGGAGLGVRGAW